MVRSLSFICFTLVSLFVSISASARIPDFDHDSVNKEINVRRRFEKSDTHLVASPSPKDEKKDTPQKELDRVTREKNKIVAQIDGEDLFKQFKKQVERMVGDGKTHSGKMGRFREEILRLNGLKKDPFDVHLVNAVELEYRRLMVEMKDRVNWLETKKLNWNDPISKQEMMENLMFLNMDDVMIAYGMEMLKLSERPPNPPLNANELQLRATLEMQKNQVKDIRANWTSQVGGVAIAPATQAGRQYDQYLRLVLPEDPGLITAPVTEYGRNYIRAGHANAILNQPAQRIQELRDNYRQRFQPGNQQPKQ